MKIAKKCDERFRINRVALIEARTRANLTQTELARRCGWSQSYMSRLETREVTVMRRVIDTLIEELPGTSI